MAGLTLRTSADSAIFPFPVLLADIGGTNARFCVKPAADAATSPMLRLDTHGYPSFARAAEEAITRLGGARPRSLLVGAAGPVHNRAASLTNANWRIDGPHLAEAMALDQGLLLNDFETLALAIPALGPDDVMAIGAAQPGPGTALVVGPGTGLGVGALAGVEGRFLPLPSEGGHTGLAAGAADEHAVLDRLGATSGRVRAELLIAGPGLMRIFQAVTEIRNHPALLIEPAEIAARALAGSDPVAVEAMRLWLSLMARFCGDMALSFMATGGVYLAGGILPRVRSLIDAPVFRAAFEDNDAHQALLASIPVNLIVAQEPAFLGLAALAAAPERYILDYGNRLWRAER